MRPHPILAGILAAAAVGSPACGASDAPRSPMDGMTWPKMDPRDKHFPDVVNGAVVPVGGGRFDIVVSLSSPYDTQFRFADGWRVLTSRGDFLGERRFGRHHAGEQPWTRTLRRVRIPPEVTDIVLEGHDMRYGWGGGAYFLRMPAQP